MKKYEKPRITSVDSAKSLINTDDDISSKTAHVLDGVPAFGTSAGYEADE